MEPLGYFPLLSNDESTTYALLYNFWIGTEEKKRNNFADN